MKIEIDLAELGFAYDPNGDPLGHQSLEQAIVIEAARVVLDGELGNRVREQLGKAITAQVEQRAQEIVEQVLTEPIQRTTPWGEAQGTPTTVREIVRMTIERWLQMSRSNDRFSSSGAPRSLADLIDAEVKSVMTKELQGEIARVKKEVAQTIQTHALQAAVAAISPKV